MTTTDAVDDPLADDGAGATADARTTAGTVIAVVTPAGTGRRSARRRSRRDRTVNSVLTHRQVTAARRQAAQARQAQAAALGRSLPKERDPSDGMKVVTTRLVRRAAAYVDADPGLVRWLEERIAAGYRRPGRPCELAVRTTLICFVIQAIHLKSFNVADIAALPESMTWRVRRDLGIDYDRRGETTTLSYTQFLDMFHKIAETFDAWDESLIGHPDEVTIRSERAEALQTFTDRLTAASTFRAPTWRGNAAVDATLKWSWERPPNHKMNSKIGRRGADGDDGPALSTIEVIGADGEIDPSVFTTNDPVEVTKKAASRRTKRKPSWPGTWSLGAAWIGNKNKSKAVHGYALHTVVRSDHDGPNVIEGFTVTPAIGDPAAAALPVLARLHARRVTDDTVAELIDAGGARLLGDIVADPAYTAAGADAWQIPLKDLGAVPIARLHRTNQDGPKYPKIGRGRRAGEVVTISGRPVCECVAHTPLATLRFPKYPYTRAELAAYQVEVVKLAWFEWDPNGGARADGSRSYLSPHGGAATTKTKVDRAAADATPGGCELCVTAAGAPVVGPEGRPRARCCTVASRLIPKDVTAFDMGMIHGSPEWYDRWNPRNRVEGSYGVLKNLAVVNYGRNYHHFVGLARETLVTVFAIVAYNDHMLRSWTAKQRLVVTDDVGAAAGAGPDATVTVTETSPDSSAVSRRRAAAHPKKRQDAGPKGMSFLGPNGPAPPAD